MASDVSTVRIRAEDLTWREVDGVVIALDLVTSTYLTTNRTGAVLWRAMVDGCSIDTLVATLRSAFGVSDDVAVADVAAFLKLLDDNGLVSVED